MNKNVIYTSIIGDYDELVDPKIITPGWDYICFSDTDKKSDVWKIRKVELDKTLSNRKNARKIKMLYHNFVGDYDTTIHVPGFSVINIDLNVIAGLLKPPYDMLALRHPRRKCLYDEANVMISYTGDPGDRIKKQIDFYKKDGMPTKFGLATGTLLIRKVGDKNVQKHCELWWEEILKHSPRDQISFMYVLWKNNLINLRMERFNIFTNCFEGAQHHAGKKEYIQKHAAD